MKITRLFLLLTGVLLLLLIAASYMVLVYAHQNWQAVPGASINSVSILATPVPTQEAQATVPVASPSPTNLSLPEVIATGENGSNPLGKGNSAPPRGDDPTILAAGDIAACDSPGDEETAALLKSIPATILALGDNAYESGTFDEFNNCYAPTWDQFKNKTFPAVGNHEYITLGASGYFDYFGAVAGDPTQGYYSYDLGAWHVIVLNANCSGAGGCNSKSPQIAWLLADLAAHPSLCTLAYWHQPRFSSGIHGNNTRVALFWQVLYQAGVDVVLNGHDHDYERFAAQNPDGLADPAHGIREFVVGTGGKNLTSISSVIANSESHNDSTWGVLEINLHSNGYDWKFLPVAGQTFTDSGSDVCH